MVQVMTKPLPLQQPNDVLATVAIEKGLNQPHAPAADERRPSGKALPKHLRDMFIKSISDALTALDAARASNDVDVLLVELHSLSGALMVFGYRELGTACIHAEEGIRRDGAVSLPEKLDVLGCSLRSMIDDASDAGP